MKFSRNPSTGVLEAYTDEGIYVGAMETANVSGSMATDGGPGSGNFGHAGRPGKVGGSGEGGGGSDSEYKKKLQSQRAEILSKDQPDQALFADRSGIADRETCIAAMRAGTASDLVNQYFDIMEANGDPTPTKPLRKFPNMYEEIEKPTGFPGVDKWTGTRMRLMREWTGMSEEETRKAFKELDTFFGGSWSRADTRVIDDYIDRDGTYDGEIYRGIKFNQDEYDEFMKNLEKGSTIRMRGMNSSWSNDEEDAIRFSKSEKPVVLKCVKNKTSAPVDHLSGQGEGEVLAHSKAQWTVLNIEDLGRRTIITVVESEHRMSDEDRAKLREKHSIRALDAAPDREKRLVEQQKYLEVVPPDEELKKKLYGETAKDGGPGSGNFNHSGRPNQVGGSAPNGGGGGSKSSSGKALASKLREKYYSMPKRTVFTSHDYTEGRDELVRRAYDFGTETDKMSDSKLDDMYEHYLKVIERNGDPSKTSKKVTYDTPRTNKDEMLTGTPEENEKMHIALVEYTTGDWKSVDRGLLEKYIAQCPVSFQDSLFRGIHLKKDDAEKMIEDLKKGTVSFGDISSWSSQRYTASTFACRDDDNNVIGEDEVPIVFYIPSRGSRSAAPVSMFSKFKEDECIFPGKARFSVVGIVKDGFLAGQVGKGVRDGYRVILMERGEEYDA